jgi:acetyl coenzyme A synthetase (ADP forming)-like protein
VAPENATDAGDQNATNAEEPTAVPPNYPARWESDVVLADGATVRIRPIKPSDGPAISSLHGRMSDESIYLRFFTPMPIIPPKLLDRFVNVDYVGRMALVAELGDQVIGVARYERLNDPTAGRSGPARCAEAEVAFTVDDAHQGRGVGTILLEHLAAVAKDNGISRFVAETLPTNQRMLRVFREAGYDDHASFEDGVIKVVFSITPTDQSIAAMQEREQKAAAKSVRRLLTPTTIAVIGASRQPGSIGHQIFRNVLAGHFTGPVYPVNPTAHQVASVRAYPTVLEIPDQVDLAVIVVPAPEVPAVLDQCIAKQVAGVVIISAGFSERSADGARAERQLVAAARGNGLRLVGPNCLGVVNTDPAVSMNATFSPVAPTPGRIGFVSQSGGLGVVILDQMTRRGLGLSTFVSAGNKADVSANDLLHYWDDDPNTDVVLLYLESFGNPRAFARIARRLSRRKPIVAVKGGRSPSGDRAATMHTGALPVSSPAGAVDAVFLHSGVIRVDTLEELFDVAQILATQPLPPGRRVAIVGNAGGPGVLAADASEAAGLEVPELTEPTQEQLKTLFGRDAPIRNPVDLAPTATPADFQHALDAVLADPTIDTAIAIFSAPLAPFMEQIGPAITKAAANHPSKPVLASVLGSRVVMEGGPRAVPSFSFPESAVRALARVERYAEWRARPEGSVPPLDGIDVRAARLLVSTGLAEHWAATQGDDPDKVKEGVWLDPASALQLMDDYGIATVRTELVASADDAVEAAHRLGFPTIVQAATATDQSPAQTKRQAGLHDQAEVAAAYHQVATEAGAFVQATPPEGTEVVVDVIQDADFGSMVAFGTGGLVGRLLDDRVFRAVPLTDLDARAMIGSVRSAPLLDGTFDPSRPAADRAALEDLLLRVGRLVEDIPEIAELHLDPVIASPNGAAATAVRVRLAPSDARPEHTLRRIS